MFAYVFLNVKTWKSNNGNEECKIILGQRKPFRLSKVCMHKDKKLTSLIINAVLRFLKWSPPLLMLFVFFFLSLIGHALLSERKRINSTFRLLVTFSSTTNSTVSKPDEYNIREKPRLVYPVKYVVKFEEDNPPRFLMLQTQFWASCKVAGPLSTDNFATIFPIYN